MQGALRLLRSTLALVVGVAGLSALGIGPALAGCVKTHNGCVDIQDPGTPGSGDPGGGVPGGGGGGGGCTENGKPIPCTDGFGGIWIQSRQCYAKRMSPQPGPKDGIWGGRDPEKGDMWVCGNAGLGGQANYFYLPDGRTPPMIDPGDLAQEAYNGMSFPVPAVHTAPAAPNKGYVTLPTWFWTDPATFEPLEVSATAGPTTVTLTVRPSFVIWYAGDGEHVVCRDAGREWVAGMAGTEQSDCSHTYTTTSANEPGGVYTISAVVYYTAEWACSGACMYASGELEARYGPAGTASLVVDERQSVVVGGEY